MIPGMTRLGIATVMVIAIAGCSDDGVPATGTGNESGDGTGSATEASSAGTSGGTASGTASSVSGVEESTGASMGTSPGESGSSGLGSEGTTAADTGAPTSGCMTDDDCALVDDCCTCGAIALGQVPPMCEIDCDQSSCEASGIAMPAVQCELGICQLVPSVECNPVGITCDSVPPPCEDGSVPSVENNCWTGNCVPVDACNSVGSCDDCPDDRACIEQVAKGPAGFLCSPIPEGCAGTPSCACMSEVCQDPFTDCVDGPDHIMCECPAC
jgi:hypothetical protein